MIREFLGWMNPTRWLIAAGILATLAVSVWGYGAYQHHLGYVEREDEYKSAEAAQRVRNATFDAERVRDGSAQARRYDNLIDANNRKAAREKARLASNPAPAGGMCAPGSTAGVPGVPNAGGNADACARVSAGLVEANRIATNSADQVTALQAHIEASRAAYNKVTNQTDTRPVSDAEARWAARLKQAEDIAKRAEDRANGVLK